jgi:drug/metabolite transporter (DMT)-like permease
MSQKSAPYKKALIYLHISVFLWGFTAVLGKLISYGSINLVWHRMLFTAAVYLMFPSVWKSLKSIDPKNLLRFLGIGIIVCLHWLTFYGSIKMGNSVSVTLACLGSASFFTSIFEPILLKQKFKLQDVFSGLIVIMGVSLISYSLSTDSSVPHPYTSAIIVGVISAALAALFSTLNKKFIETENPLTISAIEMLSGAGLLSVFILFGGHHFISNEPLILIPNFEPQQFQFSNLQNGALDLVWVAILSILCTNLTFYLATKSLKQLSAFTANLTVNLEPIYGILLGIIIFKENNDLNMSFYAGTGIILSAIFLNSISQSVQRKKG